MVVSSPFTGTLESGRGVLEAPEELALEEPLPEAAGNNILHIIFAISAGVV